MNTQDISYDNNVAINYNKDRKDEEHWVKENEFIANYFQEKNAQKILDIPVGTGRFIQFYPATASILGIDISMPMLEEARKEIEKLNRDNIDLQLGDAGNLSVSDNTFDVIVCSRLLHLVDNSHRIKFLKELSRALKGELILQLYISPPQKKLIERIISKGVRVIKKLTMREKNIVKPWSHIKSYSLSEIELDALVAESGLFVVNRSDICKYYGSTVSMLVLRKKP